MVSGADGVSDNGHSLARRLMMAHRPRPTRRATGAFGCTGCGRARNWLTARSRDHAATLGEAPLQIGGGAAQRTDGRRGACLRYAAHSASD